MCVLERDTTSTKISGCESGDPTLDRESSIRHISRGKRGVSECMRLRDYLLVPGKWAGGRAGGRGRGGGN